MTTLSVKRQKSESEKGTYKKTNNVKFSECQIVRIRG